MAEPVTSGGKTGGPVKTGSGNGKKQQHLRRYIKKVAPKQKFDGSCEELKGFTFDCDLPGQADQFIKTQKKISVYVGSTYHPGGEISEAVLSLTQPVVNMPNDPGVTATAAQGNLYNIRLTEAVKQEVKVNQHVKNLYSLVLGQCTEALKAKIEAHADYPNIGGNGINLLRIIRNIVYDHKGKKFLPHAIHETIRRFYLAHQKPGMSVQTYLDTFQNQIDVAEHVGASIGTHRGIMDLVADEMGIDPATASRQELLDVQTGAQDRYFASAFILGADWSRFGNLIQGLQNDFIQGVDKYPKTLNDAYSLLINWKPDRHAYTDGHVADGVAFANVGSNDDEDEESAFATTDGKKKGAGKVCYNCGLEGCTKRDCSKFAKSGRGNQASGKNKEEDATQMLMDGLEHGEFDDDEYADFAFHTGTDDPKHTLPTNIKDDSCPQEDCSHRSVLEDETKSVGSTDETQKLTDEKTSNLPNSGDGLTGDDVWNVVR